jgi:hypothetical protein
VPCDEKEFAGSVKKTSYQLPFAPYPTFKGISTGAWEVGTPEGVISAGVTVGVQAFINKTIAKTNMHRGLFTGELPKDEHCQFHTRPKY